MFTKPVGFVDTSKSISGNVFIRFKIVVLYIKCNEPFSEHFAWDLPVSNIKIFDTNQLESNLKAVWENDIHIVVICISYVYQK